ncbi:MAG: CRISPR-associated helicase Cas3', partial [candidate division Zixibacteria bacterium]|nr:CRISPR-associated helicase Cas3' [candidate division Zixibacteria bacterium]
FLKEANNPKLNSSERLLNNYILFAFHYSIKQHHSPRIDYENNYYFDDEFIKDVFDVIDTKNIFDFQENIVLQIGRKFNQDILPEVKDKLSKDSFALFALLKLNYSLLTASDYLATSHFMNNWGKELQTDFGVFDNELKKKIISNIESPSSDKYEYNRKTYAELKNYKLEFPKEPNGENLNKLRQNLSVETINGIRNKLDRNLFYIEAPTGGGKTNLSMLAIAEFLRNDIETSNNNITKVFYVFPFTTLITQTFKSLKETLGLNNDEIVQIHSKAGFSQKGNDDKYGEDKINIIDYQFVNYPIALLSHIKFFDILKSNRKSANYLMHRLANSIVIIDELQTYSPSEWDKVIYFINKYAKYFNIKFILMSATLPKINELLSEEGREVGFEKEDFVYLNQNKDKYFQNPNFAERIEFDFSMLNNPEFNKDNKEEFLQNIWLKLIQESEDYKSQSEHNRVHTIIEFIFKKSASEFMEIADKENNLFDEIFILSGTTLEPRRKEIIAKLKSEEYENKDVLLITTQVVEAGVDIDMDLGFKDTSLIDSDEQLAGRINRNINKPQCKLFLFDYDDAKVIYGKDYRYKEVKKKLNSDDYHDILQTKDFDRLYNLVMEHIKDFNRQGGYTDTLPAYLQSIKNLNFDSVNKEFQLINNDIQTTSIYVPIEVPINIPINDELNFTPKELEFLKEKGKYYDEKFVCGEKVWELFCDIIENKDADFTKQKKHKIIMQGLISKFAISIGTYSENMKQIISSGYGDEKYGFYKINEISKVYDYETGIKTMQFEDINFL